MNAYSMLRFRDITIGTEYLEARREPLANKPPVEPGTSLYVPEYSSTMLVPVAFNMIDGKEVTLRFAAACTFGLAT
jgi:hypothetical protein